MRLLDKLKPQPRWKHADAAVRLEALAELDDAMELAALAEHDPDARVRRAAMTRTRDAGVLGRVAAGDADGETQAAAADRLMALATDPADPDAALAAVAGLTDPCRLSTVAKSDASDAVRAAALARTTDERALGAIARNARHESTAADALARLTDEDELLSVALTADHRDVALAAFDRRVAGSCDLGLLGTIETRAQQKAVARRARARIQEIEEAEAARRAAEEDLRRRASAIVDDLTRLADVPDLDVVRPELARLTEAWQGLGIVDEAAAERFADASAAVTRALVRREREAEEAMERARQCAEAIATRAALCARVETLDGDDVLAQLVPIEEEWRSLMPLVGQGPEADRLAERFALAVAACRKRHEMGAVLAEARETLATLVSEAEGLPSHGDAAAASARWQALCREARGLTATLSAAGRPSDDLAVRLTTVEAAFAARDAAERDALAQAQQEALAQLEHLVDRARRVAEAESITLREGERLMRDIVAGLEQAGHVAATRDIEKAAATLRSLQEAVAPRVRDLREMEEWRRFANAQQQEKLIAMAEAIVGSLKADEEAGRKPDLAATARALRELHAQWQEVAEAPRQQAQRLWQQFRAATDVIRTACESHFAELRARRAAALEAKTAIVVEAETLADSSDWGRTAARFQELQTAWKTSGPVLRGAGRDLAQRFRAACNTFFARRRDDLAQRRKVWTEHLAAKVELCERAEALADSTDWAAAAAEMKRLQAEWKTVGPLQRSKSEAVWKRFRTAADHFFERYHNRHQITLATKLAEREALVVSLEAIAAEETPADVAARVEQLRSTWAKGVPLPVAEMKPITERWQAAFTRIRERWPESFRGTDLDPATIRRKLEKLVARVESYLDKAAEPAAGRSKTELLAARLQSALSSNAIGGHASEEAKWRGAADAVREAEASWQRLALMAGGEAADLQARFRDACRRVHDQVRHRAPGARRSSRPPRSGRPSEAAAV